VHKTRGENFIDSLNDGRSILFDGEKIVDVASHSAFKGTLGTLTRLFNLLDEPNERDKVGFKLQERESYVHSAFLVPNSLADLQKRSLAFHTWSKETHGMMSRLSDYARSMITGWYAARKELGTLDPDFESKITSYYTKARDLDLFLTTAIVDPQIDRSRGLEDARVAERFLHVVRETSEGIIVRGAKMIATGAPYTNDFIISSFLEF
jgi:4-hydroxyphenylacetate 3-monooxygenase